MLADLGADVIKVELPGFGDQARWIPAAEGLARAPYFEAVNRGKRSMTLDLRKPGGAEAFLRLVPTLDVMIANFKPGTLDSWGLGYEALSAINPGLVYATGSTFGPIGPDAHHEGTDIAGQAAGGLISTTGRDDGEPTPVGVTAADYMASQNMATGILAALIARGRTGRGQRVDVSLVGGQLYAQAAELTAHLLSGRQPGRANRGHPLLHAIYGIFPTADGWVAMAGVPPSQKPAFFEALGRPDLLADPRFGAVIMPVDVKRELFAHLAEAFSVRTTAEWVTILRASGQRVAPVRGYADIVADPAMYENGYLARVEHPVHGDMTVVGNPLRLSDTPAQPGVVAPELGQHTEEILLELGYDWDDIERLRRDGAY